MIPLLVSSNPIRMETKKHMQTPPNIISDGKTLAKNTIYLYFRTLVVMIITLYTSRVVLNTLGESDFGIYNVVGGLVVMFSFVSSAMSTATQRFLSYALGQNDFHKAQQLFSLSLVIYFFISIIIIVLAETIGLAFLITQMNFPADRWNAVHWVYQLSILSFCLNIIRTPYTASIIAYEKMSFYAYISIIENILKLVIVFLLTMFKFDMLILYAILTTVVIGITNIIYHLWCVKKMTTCSFSWFWNKDMFYELFGFSGWSMFGSLAVVGANQGVNIIFNIFAGVLINAAMGIASQVQAAIGSFISSFQTAMAPQIVKLYASGEVRKMISFVNKASRLSYFLVFLVGMPLIIYCQPILTLWLGDVPKYACVFSQLLIVVTMIDSLSAPLWFSVQATGKVKSYQLLMSFFLFLNLPFAYSLLRIGLSPTSVLIMRALLQFFVHISRAIYLGSIMDFSVSEYLQKTMLKVFAVTILSLPLSICLVSYSNSFLWIIFSIIILFVQNILIVFSVGLNKEEKLLIRNRVQIFFKFAKTN